MLLDAILKLHEQIRSTKLGVNREAEITELEQARLDEPPLATARGSAAVERVPSRGLKR
jgi:NADH-quinone oxidoreductase subunit B